MEILLHIGSDRSVFLREVIAILDRETAEHAKATREFLQVAKSEKRLAAAEGEIKSYVVTRGAIYPSPISSTTLARRASEPVEE